MTGPPPLQGEGGSEVSDVQRFLRFLPDQAVSLRGCDDPTIYIACKTVEINMDAVLDASIDEVALPDDTIVKRSDLCNDGGLGRGCAHFNNEDHTASVYLSYGRQDDTASSKISGILRTPNGNVFDIETDGGMEVLAWVNLTEGYKHDVSKYQDESGIAHLETEDRNDDASDRTWADDCNYSCEQELFEKGKADQTTMVEVSVSIWYTKKFAEMEDDIQGCIDTCFEYANAALTNSLVPMRLKHHGTYLYEGEEINDGSNSLNTFSHSVNGRACADRTAVKETLKSADTAVLLQSTSNVGGIGWVDSFR